MAIALVRPDLLYAWMGPSLLIVGIDGAAGEGHALTGYYHREARVLRTLRLTVNGEQPWLCECAAVDPQQLAFNYIYPEIAQPGGGGTGEAGSDEHRNRSGIPERALEFRVTYTVHVSGLTVTIAVSNRSRHEVHVTLACALDTDYADIQEALSGHRQQQAPVREDIDGGSLTLRYLHPKLPYRTRIEPSPGWHIESGGVRIPVTLAPRQGIELELQVQPSGTGEDITPGDAKAREQALAAWRASFAKFEAPGNRAIERVVDSNVRDLASFPLLSGPPDEWLAKQAGMPLYPAFFGRDAVTAGWQAGWIDRGAALEASLTKLGRTQSDRIDDWRDEQPGRIPYQMRTGPLAVLNINPYLAYYADYASPLMYVISLANLFAWTGDTACLRRHWDTVQRILEWARTYGDADHDGYLEYKSRSADATKNQGWKDSGDAIVYEDGRVVPDPLGTCELQGYWYIAQQLMAMMCWFMGERRNAVAYLRSAADLKRRFNRDWWIEDEQFYALALDPDKRPVRAVTSNVGHCLATGILDRARLPAIVDRLFAPDMFSGWGIRTLSSSHAYYDPLSYHRGTVWAVEQGTIVFGLRRFGFDSRALDLARSMFELAELYPEYRIPECVGGYARAERPTPGAYPKANTPQLWNATAFPLVVQTVLGIVPFAPLDTLVVDPVLPWWLPEVVLRDLRVGGAKVTLRFWRDPSDRSHWELLHKEGTLHIVRQPPPESLAGFGRRAAGLVESLTH